MAKKKKLIDVPEVVEDEAIVLAKGFTAEVNNGFDDLLTKSYDAIERFWFRNTDKDGNKVAEPVAEGTDVPTGPEILAAMGTDALPVIQAAAARKDMLIGIATALGSLELIDETKLEIPFTLEWNPDGSLKSSTPV